MKFKIIIETPRFYLREFTPDDAEDHFNLNNDIEVVQYTGDVPFKNPEEAKSFLEAYDHYKKYNMGRWAVIDKTTNEFVGWCGIKYSSNINEYDIGYRFFKKHWSKGIATETAKACLNYGLNELNLSKIVGNAMKENPASIQVLHKIGMTYLKDRDCGNQPGVTYVIYQ